MMKRTVFVLAAVAVLLMLLSACAGNTGETQKDQSTEGVHGTKSPETKPSETKEMTAAEKRAAILMAASTSQTADALGRVKDAFAAAGVDMSTIASGAELIKSDLFEIMPGVATEAPDVIAEMPDWMTKDWDGGYHKLSKDLLTADERKELLDSYNDWNNTEKLSLYYNTPQQILRAYAEAKPGDVLAGVTATKNSTRDKLLMIIEKVETVYLEDGVTIAPGKSRLFLIDEKGEKREMLFQVAFAQYFAVPYRLAALGEESEEDVSKPEAQTASLPEDPVLRVGFGRADITSDIKIPLAGYGNTSQRMSDKTIIPEDRLMATAIALSDGTNTEILYTMDMIKLSPAWSKKAADAIEEATGIPADHVSFSATHTHSGPDIGDNEGNGLTANGITSSQPYFQVWKDAVVQAAKDAVADLAPVSETKIAVTEIAHMNWTRHWRANGKMAGVNFYAGANQGAVEIADPNMQLIRFVRDDQKDVVLVNWQAHGTVASTALTNFGTAHRQLISADYAGYLRRYVEKQDPDCLVAYFLGASGNVNPYALEEGEQKYNITEVDEFGEKLGRYVLKAMANMTTVETGAVQKFREEHAAFPSGYEGALRNVQQNVITVGKSLAFVTAGYEMFNASGMAIKERSPFAMTFVCTCAQRFDYIPTFQTYHYHIFGKGQETAYEAGGSECKVVPGTAEDLVDGYIAMMDRLWENLGLTEKDVVKPLAEKVQHFQESDVTKPEPANLALGASVTYTYRLITKEKYFPELINDGERGEDTLTAAAGWYFVDNGEIVFDLGTVQKISGYAIYNYKNPTVYGGIKDWTVYISADGENWEAKDTVKGNEGASVKTKFDSLADARYVKLTAHDAWENTKLDDTYKEKRVLRIGEFMIYGE